MIFKLFAGVLFVTFAAWTPALAQETGVESVLAVLRQQAGSLSEDVLGAIGVPYPLSLGLSVEEAPLPTVIEYAFLEKFSGRGVTLRSAERTMEYSNRLTVLVFEQRATFDSLSSGGYLRTVRTVIEGRFSPEEGGTVRYLGSFERTSVDTVAAREELPWTRPVSEQDEESSAFSKILAPLVIITGAALIVYLFFAVRSS